ncbi:coniferyl aldehyde dehydrogenase [Bradyrhizobium sp. WD16]|uniref:coniferyl aldehyde dehydrogenase n=1 Tax=Bradyrhizobium sp. WD16 TaxID=1521768 RepID=UPI0020A51B08|nr:coniferyl aldehyde dehydrogenase [Bradyrhizobium sp. WD16]UTD28203.1 coniferyl aldehyde dehydrogenase [Bradyrhizobium sp. WD16]
MDIVGLAAPANAIEAIFHRQRSLSRTAPPPDLAERLDRLRRLRGLLASHEEAFASAISDDFGHRPAIETMLTETLFLLGEIKHTVRSLKGWMAPRRVATQLQFWPAKNRLLPQPLGVVGVIAPWNYPLQLTLAPAIGAIAAGNRVMIKPSEFAPRFAGLLREAVGKSFDATELAVTGIENGVAEVFSALPFDHLVFTGSTKVGRIVAAAAGRNLTPVTLELGGKSPVIVDRSADVAKVAERVAYAKLLNAGQTCIAPDYVFVPEAMRDALAEQLQSAMTRMIGSAPANPDYTSIISDRHYARLDGLVADAVARGAGLVQPQAIDTAAWKSRRKFPPTILLGAKPEMAIMQEEIFGPVLPIMSYRDAGEPIAYVNAHDRPLALYWFGEDTATRDDVLARTVSGGATINDCLLHFAQVNQPMGGVGASGCGAYHGPWGFDAFSKLKPVFYRSPLNRFADAYPPYGPKIARLIKLIRFVS